MPVYTYAGYFLRIDCNKAEEGLKTTPCSECALNALATGKGYRQLLIDNYIAIFRIDEPCKTVYVVTIQYQGRNL